MTGMTRSSAGLNAERKRLLFRSWHRGIKEMDLVLGSFADAHIGELSDEEIKEYADFISLSDHDMFKWLSGAGPVPPEHDTPMYRKILEFRSTMEF